MPDTYDASGVRLTGKSTVRGWGNTYKPMEVIMGGKGKKGDGEDVLITEAFSGGKPDEDATAELYGGANPPESQNVMLVRMHDPNNPGFDFYQEIPSQSVMASGTLNDLYGESANMSQEMEEQQAMQQSIDKIKVSNTDQQVRAMAEIDDAIAKKTTKAVNHAEKSETINSPYFQNHVLKAYNKGSISRAKLIQSFYQAAAEGSEEKLVQAADGKMFNQAVDKFGLNELLLKQGVTDQDIIDTFHAKDYQENGDVKKAYSYSRLWAQIYQEISK